MMMLTPRLCLVDVDFGFYVFAEGSIRFDPVIKLNTVWPDCSQK